MKLPIPLRTLLPFAVVCGTLLAVPSARAQNTLTTLHRFDGTGGTQPQAGLVLGNDGNFYGSTSKGPQPAPDQGGAPGGTIFKITPSATLTTIYTAPPPQPGFTNNNGGTGYASALTLGTDGNFYGVASGGGVNGNGTVFKLTPAGAYTTLHDFSANVDGNNPSGALVQGADGNFYGTTSGGGGPDIGGTVFKITPDGTLTTLHRFDSNQSHDTSPYGKLALGSDGNFYGCTTGAGIYDDGSVFKMTPAGEFTTLHTFDLNLSDDGGLPYGGLVQGADGSFYGTTSGGGSGQTFGTVFKITSTGVFTTLYKFANESDGAYPTNLILGKDGNFYGTTSSRNGTGTVFSITADGQLTTLYQFDGGTDGGQPNGPLLQAGDGSFYGTTTIGGTNNDGTIFHLTLTQHPAFFTGEVALGQNTYYLAFPGNGNIFGYYEFYDAADPHFLYHFDLGFEYVFDAADGHSGVYLYDFKSNTFWYTSPTFPFPYLYDFSLQAFLYYYPDPHNPGRYNTDGVRYFYNFSTGQIISK